MPYVPEFFTKTESSSRYRPHFFVIEFLFGFAVGLVQDCCCVLSVPCACISGGHLQWSFILVVYFCFVYTTVFGVPHSFVLVCASTADEDRCMVLSLGVYAVWLSFLVLRYLYGVLDSGQLCPSLVDRRSVPWACLPLPPLVPFGLIDIVCFGPVFLIPGLPSFGWIRHSVLWACLPPSWVDMFWLDGSFRRTGCPAAADQDL